MNTEEIKIITIKELCEYYNNKIEEYENFVIVDNIEIVMFNCFSIKLQKNNH